MNISEPFIRKPVATTLLVVAITLAGASAYRLLPVSPLPQVEFPTISVNAGLPGASPQTMASSVATPLERQFGRIAAVTEMSSSSSLGSASLTLQFDLDRDIDAAARDVQAAINAARGSLPANLPNNPSYRKVNPADSPIFMLALTSPELTRGQMYDAASTVMAQKLSQVGGVGQVTVGGGSLPAVRIELNPTAMDRYGIGLEQVRTVLSAANANRPKGHLSDGHRTWEVGANDQLFKAADYAPLVIAYRKGSAVRISDVGQAEDSVENLRNSGYANGKPSVLLSIFRQPGANIIDTVDRIRTLLPQIKASIPQSIDVKVANDQTVTIRASVKDTERMLAISVLLVILVVFCFLRDARTTFIPSVAVPVSLVGTFGVMYVLGYSLDNLSLMALTISTGFVVDDAIVVIENVTRYLEQGMHPFEAALRGAQEVGFTVLTISVSLVAVFIPLLLMGGIVGRLFREFAVTLSVAIGMSMAISLTATPMMCAYLLREQRSHGWMYRTSERAFTWVVDTYGRTLSVALRFRAVTLVVLLATIGLNVYLFIRVPKGFFPQQDNGRIQGSVQGDQDISFQALDASLLQMINIVDADPAVDTVNGFTGGGNTARLFISLKPLDERKISAAEIIARLRPTLVKVPGVTMYLQASQDLRVGGRQSNAQYQFLMQGDNLDDLTAFAPRMVEQLRAVPLVTDVSSDQQNRGLQSFVHYDRATAARFGITPQLIDATLYDAFGQRPVSTMYTSLNQYHVVMEAAPEFWQNPLFLRQVYVHAPGGQAVPLGAFATFAPTTAPLTVTHAGLFPAVTISFNLKPGAALGDAVNATEAAAARVGLPPTIQTAFAGTAQAYQDSLGSEPILIAAALVTVYIILAILYESYIHPITIISSLPAASVGALLALLVTHNDLDIIAIIGIILLIGIVKKNAIMMIDFALAAERNEGKNSYDSIVDACRLRFRPILMTTMAALLGALPLAFGTGTGSELRRPLGISIIGGLIVSQLLTLYTTPVVYLYFNSANQWLDRMRRPPRHRTRPEGPSEARVAVGVGYPGAQMMTDRYWGSGRAWCAAGVAVVAVTVPAVAQQETLSLVQQSPPRLEMVSAAPPARQPASPGGQAPDDQQKDGQQEDDRQQGDQRKGDQQKREDGQPGTTSNRLFGTLPDFLTVENMGRMPPLTTRQKFNATSRSTFDWGQYVFCAGLAGIGQAQNADPSYRQGAVGYAKRFGLAFADLTTENFMTTAVVPSLLHQDPRYYRMGKGNVFHRIGYSVSRILVTRSDAGHEQFNLSEIGGALGAASLYNAYHPSSDRTVGDTLSSWVWQIGYDMVEIVVREFWPDIHRRFTRTSKPTQQGS